MQLPVVLAVRPEVQGGPLRQMERVRLHWPPIHRRVGQVQALLVCSALALVDTPHPDNEAHQGGIIFVCPAQSHWMSGLQALDRFLKDSWIVHGMIFGAGPAPAFTNALRAFGSRAVPP